MSTLSVSGNCKSWCNIQRPGTCCNCAIEVQSGQHMMSILKQMQVYVHAIAKCQPELMKMSQDYLPDKLWFEYGRCEGYFTSTRYEGGQDTEFLYTMVTGHIRSTHPYVTLEFVKRDPITWIQLRFKIKKQSKLLPTTSGYIPSSL